MRVFKNIAVVVTVLCLLAGCSAATVGSKPSMSAEEKEKLLRQRISENWQAMIDRDRGKVYDIYDPFFRAATTKEYFEKMFVPVTYHGFRIADILMQGNVAAVSTEIEYSIEHIGLTGKKITQDKTTKVLKEKWLFMDGTWFRQFYDAIAEGTFAQY